ncbi:uncharacterized protein BDW70DRAFT_130570 [Aspergillus foveolatus]|uniref:uncharacterized protein n=1 Tax=Aspergillus foveolatus TaxID=210207 RepID=UPI003CCD3FA3
MFPRGSRVPVLSEAFPGIVRSRKCRDNLSPWHTVTLSQGCRIALIFKLWDIVL